MQSYKSCFLLKFYQSNSSELEWLVCLKGSKLFCFIEANRSSRLQKYGPAATESQVFFHPIESSGTFHPCVPSMKSPLRSTTTQA